MIFAFEDFELDAHRLELRRRGDVVHADAVVLRVLSVLLANAGHLVTKEELVEQVWEGRAVADNVITVAMARLRRVLGEKRGDDGMVTTVWGRGYRFVRDVRQTVESRSNPPNGMQAAGRSPTFVGRERVMETLEHAFLDAERGHGRLCAVMGEPGIGKTFVAEAFTRGARTKLHAHWGFCREAIDAPPLFPWVRILRELRETTETVAAVPEFDEPAIQALLAARIDAEGPTAALDAVGRGRQERYLVYDAVARLLATAARAAPRVLILEDLHRADSSTLELLGHLLEEIALRRMLVIATVRQSEVPAREPVRARLAHVLGHRNSERIELKRLSEAEVRTYVSAVLGENEPKLARAVFHKSEGNPFFMAELCRQLRDREPGSSGVLAMPDAALELIRQHLARLDGDSRGVLSAASVIGKSFELPLLRAIVSRDASSLMASLDAALAAEILVAAPDSATAFAFGHDLLRSVLYDGLPPAERRAWHVRIANALDQRASQGEAIAASEVAFHFHAGLPEADARKTVHYCRLAAGFAAGTFANDDLVRYVRKGLEALELVDQPSLRLRMHFLYLIAMYARGDNAQEYESASRELARLARESGDAPMLGRAAVMFNLHPGFKELPGIAHELSCALELLPKEDEAMRAVCLASLAMSTPACYSAKSSHRLLAEALPLARASNSRAARYVAGIAQLWLYGGPAHQADAGALREELELLAQQNPTRMPVLPVDLALHGVVVGFYRGDLAAAARWAESAAAYCRRLHHEELLWQSERMRTLVDISRGTATRAAQLDRLHERASPGLFGVATFVAFDRALAAEENEERRSLSDQERQALAYDASDPSTLWSMKIRALAALGLHDEARAALRALSPDDLKNLPCDRDHLGTLGHILRAALLVSAMDYARVAAEMLGKYRDGFAAHISCYCEGSVPHLLGEFAYAMGDHDRAAIELEEGLARDEAAGLVRCAAQARVALGRVLRERGKRVDQERASSLLAEAQSSASRFGLARVARIARTAAR